jgi:hypothetical protein
LRNDSAKPRLRYITVTGVTPGGETERERERERGEGRERRFSLSHGGSIDFQRERIYHISPGFSVARIEVSSRAILGAVIFSEKSSEMEKD